MNKSQAALINGHFLRLFYGSIGKKKGGREMEVGNAAEILKLLGYDVVNVNDGVYSVNILGKTCDLKTGKLGFNSLGNLFVEFVTLDGEKVIDRYEYKPCNTNKVS